MNPLDNPFSPGAGSPPPELVGRDLLLERTTITLHRLRAGRPAKSLIFVGLRGVGKTVMLNRVRMIAIEQGYRAVHLEAREGKALPQLLVPSLRQILFQLDAAAVVSEKVKRGFRVLRSFAGALTAKAKMGDVEIELGVDPERGSGDSGDLETDLAELFAAVGQAAADRSTAIALCLDEMQYLSELELSALIMAMHRCSQDALPVALFGAGLPQVVGLAGRSKSYAERLFDYPIIGPLPLDDVRDALQAPVQKQGADFADEAVATLFQATHGYPYFVQQWAYEAWNIAIGPTISNSDVDEATRTSVAELDRSFFRVRFDRLTPREKDYLRALAALGEDDMPQRSGDIAIALRARPQSVAPLRNGLIKKGMIYSPAHGDVAFTVPLFGDFMRRAMPHWEVK
ncbi:AAA ATPase domain-containing protein [Bryocella elongata]|uniref:AAA ATPase domain-containing protein n=1 Tax=Bryocella elongata TaxID=863522 RepID=A0A1H5YLN0_9BACT|nr:AAA family ATPase [Bryocella elongata]SEG24904.1 AAA ATPase domain-containing protein [Bryocella elongata]